MSECLSEAEFNGLLYQSRVAQLEQAGLSAFASEVRLPSGRGRFSYTRADWGSQIKGLYAEFALESDMEVHLPPDDELLITFFLDGGIQGQTGDRQRSLNFRPRRAMLRLPNARDGFVVRIPAKRHNAFVQLRVQRDFFRHWLEDLRVALPATLQDQLGARDGRVLHNSGWTSATDFCLNQIASTRLPRPYLLPYFNAKSLELLTLFTHEFASTAHGRRLPAADRVVRAEEMLCANLAVAPSLETIAKELGWNVTSLKTAFRDRYGMPPYAYLREARLLHAAQLLCRTRHSVYAVAQECGWACQSRFGHAFARRFGASPSAWRSRGVSSA